MAKENNTTSLRGTKQSVSLIPKLRFKEFDGSWEQKKLGTIFKINAGGDINKSHVSKFKNEKYKYPIYANAEKNKGFYGYSDIYKVEKGTITVAGRGVYIGIAHARDHKFYPIVRLLVLIPKRNENIYFYEYQINKINLFKESTGVPQLTAPQISGYQIAFPKLPEQQKIASFLTSVDTKIQQLTTKKQYLKNYKKGVMQQLFSQQFRFKNDDGFDFSDWEEKKLGEVFNNIGGTALEKHFSKSGTHKVVSIGNYSIEGKYNENGQRIILNEKTKTKLLDKGDLVMVLNDKTSTGDIIGSTILIPENNLYIYNQRSERLICEKSIIYPIYAWFQLNYKEFRKTVFSVSQGGTQIYVNFSEVKKLNIKIPSLKEQQKIANYLSAIDTKIENVQTQIEKTQTFKKGLLQGMFV